MNESNEKAMLFTLLETLQTSIADIRKDTNQIPVIAEKVNRVHETMFGNGNPKNSLTDRLSVMEAKVKFLIAGIAMVGTGIIGWIVKELLKMIGK